MESCHSQAPSTTSDFFTVACKLVDMDRAQMYGDGTTNMRRIARLWSEYLGVDIRAKDVAAMMILHKVSRIAESHKRAGMNTHDSWIDIAGYAALGDSI